MGLAQGLVMMLGVASCCTARLERQQYRPMTTPSAMSMTSSTTLTTDKAITIAVLLPSYVGIGSAKSRE